MDDCSIDYQSLIQSDLFQNEYLTLANRLKTIDLDKLFDPQDERLSHNNITAFFISKKYLTKTIFLLK